MVHNSIQNLIFDLGGVLLNLHVDRTHQAFADLSGKSIAEIKKRIGTTSFFNDYEKGLYSDEEFRVMVKGFLSTDLFPSQIDTAWNAMLGDVPVERLDLLTRLKSKYRIFLLSNTNAIHLDHFSKAVQLNSGLRSLDSFFEKAYYSHLLKMRKPEPAIFEFVLKENQLDPGATLFLDDNLENLAGAQKVGIQTFHVTQPDVIHSLFS